MLQTAHSLDTYTSGKSIVAIIIVGATSLLFTEQPPQLTISVLDDLIFKINGLATNTTAAGYRRRRGMSCCGFDIESHVEENQQLHHILNINHQNQFDGSA
jgi:hypothetical protein